MPNLDEMTEYEKADWQAEMDDLRFHESYADAPTCPAKHTGQRPNLAPVIADCLASWQASVTPKG